MTTASPAGSVKELAKMLGVRETAVIRAINDRRISAKRNKKSGRITIPDLAKAREEWETNSRPWISSEGGRRTGPPSGLAIATQQEREARAKLAQLAYETKSKQLVPVADVMLDWASYITRCKTKLLALPSRAKQRIPHLTVSEIAELDALVREALAELADEEPR
jgi:hypothetical protein